MFVPGDAIVAELPDAIRRTDVETSLMVDGGAIPASKGRASIYQGVGCWQL